MSSILKALKKVEKEKGPVRGDKSPVTREILGESMRPEKNSRSRSRLLLIFLVLLGGGIAGGVLLMQRDEIPPAQTVRVLADLPPAEAPEALRKPSVAPEAAGKPSMAATEGTGAVSAPVADTTPVPAPAVVATPDPLKVAEEVALTTREATAALRDTADSLRDTADALKNKVIVSSQAIDALSAKDEKNTSSPAAPPAAPSAVVAAKPLPVVPSKPTTALSTARVAGASENPGWHLSREAALPPVPELRVSEIHWRPLAKERLAVVNDLPVLEGVDIEGARVDRIFKDRIRFIVNGRYLEVKLGSKPGP
jgi:hypothetical protein